MSTIEILGFSFIALVIVKAILDFWDGVKRIQYVVILSHKCHVLTFLE